MSIDRSITHVSMNRIISITSEISLTAPFQATLDLLFVILDLFHMNEIIQHVVFCVWLLSFSRVEIQTYCVYHLFTFTVE